MQPFTLPPVSVPQALAALCWLPYCAVLSVPAQDDPALPLPDDPGFGLIGVSAGTLSVQLYGQACLAEPGTAVGFPGSAPPTLYADTDCTLLCAYLTGAAAERLLPETLAQSPYFPNGYSPMAQSLHPLLHQAQLGHLPAGTAVSAAAFSLLSSLYGTSAPFQTVSPYPPLVQQAIAIIQQDFAHLYGIEDLADRLEVTAPHLIRSFSRAVGTTPGQYLTQVRIEFAKRLLRSQAGTIEEIAAFSGFSSPGYFGKVFRRTTGLSPSAYARTAPPLPPADLSAFYV